MLEKIGLPAKPSMRGNSWVVDASHCQGCSSQFTFINRKHHCRRCGGLFCNSCTLSRMVLRGQGDSPVRICEPCKQLEDAARFEMRYGHKNRARKGSSRSVTKQEDEMLDQILGNDSKKSSSSGQQSSIHRASSTSSCSTICEEGQEIHRILSVDEPGPLLSEVGSVSPGELRERALDEKKKYKILKTEGKSEEALKAFKRGKELERQAETLELSIRKNRKKVLASSNMTEIEKKDGITESGSKRKLVAQASKEKDDLTAELRQLGWSDMDLHDEDKKQVHRSVESELFSLLGDVSRTTDKGRERSGGDRSQVVEHKKRALALKRLGKLAEAKEELKKAKILEKQLEEQELLGAAEDSDDDDISALIRSMDNDNEDDLSGGNENHTAFDFDRLMGIDDIGIDDRMEVTDKDLMDPELTATLKSLGWDDDIDMAESISPDATAKRESLQREILSLKREALNLKRAGKPTEAMAPLKKAKELEKNLQNLGSANPMSMESAPTSQNKNANSHGVSKFAPKSRMMIQKELLALKKKALALRREGKSDEAEEELKKGRVLEEQLAEMDNPPKLNATSLNVGSKDLDLAHEYPSVSGDTQIGEVEQGITDQDMHDPTYLSILENLGWKDEDDELAESTTKPPSSVTKPSSNVPTRGPRRSKTEVQRELLGLKRKALGLRREGKTDEAEEVLRSAKALEAEIAELESPMTEALVESNRLMENNIRGHLTRSVKDDEEIDDVTENDMHDQTLVSMLQNVGWKDEEQEAVNVQGVTGETVSTSSVTSSLVSSASAPRSKREVQRELLCLKRNALALRRKGETEEAEELLKKAKILEAQLEELEGTQKESIPEPSTDIKSKIPDSSIVNESEGLSNAGEAMTANSVFDSREKDVQTFSVSRENRITGFTSSSGSYTFTPFTSQQTEKNDPLLGETFATGADGIIGTVRRSQDPAFISSPSEPSNVLDLLTGDVPGTDHVQAEDQGDKFGANFSASYVPDQYHDHETLQRKKYEVNPGSDVSAPQEGKQEERAKAPMKPSMDETDSAKTLASHSVQSLHDEVLVRKRKAVALKRDGKLTEALEELRQAKLLEKSMEQNTSAASNATVGVSTSMPAASVQEKELAVLTTASKPVSGRDRFKLQQESLSHKRQALKLRREGRIDEAEAEFELAKSLEAQLEDMNSRDTSKSSLNAAGPANDVTVEDLLDPQLLSALRAIGIEDTNITPQVPEKPGPVKSTTVKSDTTTCERSQLEERIRAEKVKAVNLKRQGKQAEALDALRRAKLYEKTLTSLESN